MFDLNRNVPIVCIRMQLSKCKGEKNMNTKKIISVLLAICMIFSSIPITVTAFAGNLEDEAINSAIENQDEAKERLEDLIPGKDYVEDEIIIKTYSESADETINEITSEYDVSEEYSLSDCIGATPASDDETTETYVVSIDEGSSTVSEMIEEIEKKDNVIYAQPNYIYNLEDDSSYTAISETEVKSYESSQEAMFDTLNYTWSANGGEGIKIAVLDSGVDIIHPALVDALWSKNGNYGYNVSDPNNITGIRSRYETLNEHGTHVAGIIAMQADSSEYTCRGIAPGVEIVNIQLSPSATQTASYTTSAIVAGIKLSQQLDVDIINMSIGGSVYDFELNIACNNAARDIVIIASAGNGYSGTKASYPGAYSSVIGVMAYGGSTSPSTYNTLLNKISNNSEFLAKNYPSSGNQVLSQFTNYDLSGRRYDVIAPGVNICSLKWNGRGSTSGYCFKDGTSMAAPIVAGAAALYMAKYPNATAGQVREALRESSCSNNVYLYDYLKNGSTTTISGKLDINALLAAQPDASVNSVYEHASDPAYADLCNLIKRSLGYNPGDNITITNDDISLVSNIIITSYEEVDGCIDKLDEFEKLMFIKISGYSFTDNNVVSLLSENNLNCLEILEIHNTNCRKFSINSNVIDTLRIVNVHDNKNLRGIENLSQITNLETLILDNNCISNLNFLSGLDNLSNIYLDGNKIKDVSFLSNLDGLSKAYLADNLITNIDNVLALKNKLSLVDVSNNYLSYYETQIENLLNSEEDCFKIIYKPFKTEIVDIESIVLNDFSIKRTDTEYFPKVVTIPNNATYKNNTILSVDENDIVVVDEYTGKVSYNPAYTGISGRTTTDISYTNGGTVGTAEVTLLTPTINELNFERYTYDSTTVNAYISLLTTTDTTKVKVTQTLNGENVVEPVFYENIAASTSLYKDTGDERIISFEYTPQITEGATLTVYTGDALKTEYDSEIINANNTIDIEIEDDMITSLSGTSDFLYLKTAEPIMGVESNAIGTDCDISTIYFDNSTFMDDTFELMDSAFDGCTIDNLVFETSDLLLSGEDAFIDCGNQLTVYTYPNDEFSDYEYFCTDFMFSNGILEEYSGRDISVTIPSVLKITEIGEEVFKDNTTLTTITINKTVETIGNGAFYNCTSLTTINGAKNVKNIGSNAFRNTRVSELNMPCVEEIGANAFRDCINLENIILIGDLNKNIFNLSNYAFYDCTGLATITYDGTLKTNANTFRNCTNLVNVDCIDIILNGNGGFQNCTSLKEVRISTDSDIKPSSFKGCTSLESIGLIKKNNVTVGSAAFENATALREIGFLSESITLASSAFTGCSSDLVLYCNPNATDTTPVTVCTDFTVDEIDYKIVLTNYNGNSENIIIPDCLEIYEVGTRAFYSDDTMKSVYIPDSVHVIGANAFAMSDSLQTLTGGKYVEEIETSAFYNDKKLTDISCFESLQYIGDSAFAWCGLEGSYEMPNNVYYAGFAFMLCCKSLEEIILSKNLTTIYNWSFQICESLKRCILPPRLNYIYTLAFSECSNLNHIYLPKSVSYVTSNAFDTTTKLYSSEDAIANVRGNVLPDCIEYYPNYEVSGRTLTEYTSDTGYDYTDSNEKRVIEVPNIVENINSSVFYRNKQVDKVILNDYVDVINSRAFEGATSLKEIVMPKTMSMIAESAFKQTKLIGIEIPEGITTIKQGVFSGVPLEYIVIPNTVTSLEQNALGNGKKLRSVYIHDGVTSIVRSALPIPSIIENKVVIYSNNNAVLNAVVNEYCDYYNNDSKIELRTGYNVLENVLVSYSGTETEIQIPYKAGINAIGNSAFKNNTNITTVSIPDGVTSVGDECFSGCTSLTSIVVPDDVDAISDSAFTGLQNFTIYCTEDSYAEEYCTSKNITVNTDFKICDGILQEYRGSNNIISIPSNLCITEIGQDIISNNTSVLSVNIPEGVEVIKSGAFANHNNLTTVTVGESVIVIEDGAFANSPNVTIKCSENSYAYQYAVDNDINTETIE